MFEWLFYMLPLWFTDKLELLSWKKLKVIRKSLVFQPVRGVFLHIP